MGIAVLGPLEVDGQVNGLSPRDRVVLSALVVRAGDPSSTEALADVLWGDDLPQSWAKVVHGCVARLRKRLGAAAIESGAAGYRLTVNETEVDSRRFERLFENAREALAGGDPHRTSYLVQEALELWRGQALADLEEWGPGRVEAARLEGLRMDAEELRVEAETRAGRARDVLERARALVAEAPFRERRWALLAVALHQAGRQAEALAALKQARSMLVEQLGLDPGRELVELEEQLLRQDPPLDPVISRDVSVTCPYRGLLPYGAEDADSFFGREADVAASLRKLRDARVLAVVGPSGIGKSSLVRAGVVASLVRSGAPVLVTTPGVRPIESLSGLRTRQTLVVDQAEEAVTTCENEEERERYFAALAAHAAAGGALVLSMRTDHLGDLAPYPDMARLLEDGLYLLGPMSEPDLRSAVEGPARRAGLRLEAGLVDLLVRDVEGEPAALPLLSHVLRETWVRREGPTLTVAGYQATGGIRSAVAQSAEKLYDAMDAAQRARLRTLLLRLVMPTEDGDPVRARVPRSKVAADDEHQRLVEQLVKARLVSIDGDSVQIAHEALVRVWPRLRGWLDDDVDGQRIFRHLAGAADAWDAMGRPESELYRGARLARTAEWRDRADPDLNEAESAFLDASAALEASEVRAAETRLAEQRRVNRRLRGSLVGVGVLLILAMVAGLVAVRSADRADRERDLAAGERDLAARERDRAEQAANLADARRAGAQGVLHEDIATGLLLAVEGVRAEESTQAWENLGATLTRAGALSGVRDVGELLGESGTAWMPSVSASEKGELIASNVLGDQPRLFDAETLAPVPFEDVPPPAITVAMSPDGRRLAVGVARDDDQALLLYDLPRGTLSRNQPGGSPASSGLNEALPVRRGSGLQPRRQPLGRGASAVRLPCRGAQRLGAHPGLGPERPRRAGVHGSASGVCHVRIEPGRRSPLRGYAWRATDSCVRRGVGRLAVLGRAARSSPATAPRRRTCPPTGRRSPSPSGTGSSATTPTACCSAGRLSRVTTDRCTTWCSPTTVGSWPPPPRTEVPSSGTPARGTFSTGTQQRPPVAAFWPWPGPPTTGPSSPLAAPGSCRPGPSRAPAGSSSWARTRAPSRGVPRCPCSHPTRTPWPG